MLLEKKVLSAADLEAQSAFELPDRELMALVNVVALNGADLCGVNAAVLAQDGSAECTARNDFEIGQGARNRFGIIQ